MTKGKEEETMKREGSAPKESGGKAQRIYRIGLVICASNFERHQIMIRAVHRALKEKGPYALYVITNYGIYYGDQFSLRGEAADFSLLDRIQLDGCILESNLGSDRLAGQLTERLRKRNIPVAVINLNVSGTPTVRMKLGRSGERIMEYLIGERGCGRIYMVMSPGHSLICEEMREIYRRKLEAHHLPYMPERILETLVSPENGRRMLDRIMEMDAGEGPGPRAVICVHDVCAVGMCLEAEERGIRIPEDLLVCSLNYSQNSMIFRPDLTGVDRQDQTAAELACDLVEKMAAGESVPLVNYYEGTLRYGRSTGGEIDGTAALRQRSALQHQALTKIEMGGQVSRMMRFNSSVEKAESLEDWARSLSGTLEGLGCRGFFCCLNQDDLAYIESSAEDPKTEDSPDYDSRMTVVTGFSRRTGEIRNQDFPLEELVPVQPEAGDQFLVLPIHHADRAYGYTVFLNDDLPIDHYVFRIFQESLGDSIDNLHKKMILKGHIWELDQLHMTDQMTGLYNRFALTRFAPDYTRGGLYTTLLADLDGLKTINDSYGHLVGNNAICLIAEVLKEMMGPDELILRYGGDEFLILSRNTDPAFWEGLGEKLNLRLEEEAGKQRLPYSVSVSVGYAVRKEGEAGGLEEQIEKADRGMYGDKLARHPERRERDDRAPAGKGRPDTLRDREGPDT